MNLIITDLIYAFCDYSGVEYFFDIKDKKVICISEDIEEEAQEESADCIESESKRYIPIPCEDSKEPYDDMSDFIETLNGEGLKEKLYIAITGPGVFRRFKDVLLDYPAERETWFKFREDRTRKRVFRWLESNGIKIEDL